MNLINASVLLLLTALAMDVSFSRHVRKPKSAKKHKHRLRNDDAKLKHKDNSDSHNDDVDSPLKFLNLNHKISALRDSIDDVVNVYRNADDNSVLRKEITISLHKELHELHKKFKDKAKGLRSEEPVKMKSVLQKARDGINKLLQTPDMVPTLIHALRSSIKKVQTYCLLFVKKLASVEDGLTWDNRNSHEFATYVEIINSIVINVAIIKKEDLEVPDPSQAFNNAANAGYSAAMSNYAGNATEKVDRTFYDVAVLLSKLQPLHDLIESIPSNGSPTEYLSYAASFGERYKQADLMILGHMVALDMIDYIAEEVAQDLLQNVGDLGAGRFVVLRRAQSEGVVIKVLLLGLVMENIDDLSSE